MILASFLERMTMLYEQGADYRRIGQYVRNWWRWVNTGVEISVMNVFLLPIGRTYLHTHYYTYICATDIIYRLFASLALYTRQWSKTISRKVATLLMVLHLLANNAKAYKFASDAKDST